MKENLDNQENINTDFEELLFDENYENKNISKEIDFSIYDYQNKKSEKFKLLNEKEEILICKEDLIENIKSTKENEEFIKISDIYKGEEEDSLFYLNKKEVSKKLIKNAINLEKEEENSIIDSLNNKDKNVMEKLYNEVQLKHPRKIINGKIKRYPFFSWSGFFCCNKSEYLSLGQGYITYFNTIKLLIVIFLIIFLIHIYPIALYTKFSPIFNSFSNETLLSTTLGNTIIGYFNTSIIFIDASTNLSSKSFHFECTNNSIEEIILIKYYYDIPPNKHDIEKTGVKKEMEIEFYKLLYALGEQQNYYLQHYDFGNYYIDCKGKNSCNIELKSMIHENDLNISEYHQNKTFVISYSCRKISIDKERNTEKNVYILDIAVIFITLITLVILIIFYNLYKYVVTRDQKEIQEKQIFINNFTLVLSDLKIISDNFNQEMNDLISFLNNIINNHKHLLLSNNESYKEINFNIFDISISEVNQNKIDLFKKIKTLQNDIKDIKNDKDSLKEKLKDNIKEIYHSIHSIVTNLSDKEVELQENEESENNIINENKSSEQDEGGNFEKEIKIAKKKNQIYEELKKINVEITKLHKENSFKKYSNIYITFRNQLIPHLIYDIYNKSKFIRFIYYIFCQSRKLKNLYYKNQWLNFDIAKDNPSDIKWENCYISSWKKFGRKFLSILASLIIVISIGLINIFINLDYELTLFLKSFIPSIVNITSGLILNFFTKFEKHSSKSKEIIAGITKIYWMNLIVSISIFFINENMLIFSYFEIEKYYYLNKVLIKNMIWSIFLSQIASIVFYLWDMIKRFSDSKWNNGKTTQLTSKVKYEKIYLGGEFPFSERYAKIFVNLSICLFYGTNCPIIYIFFILFLIVTFIVDKYLMINYYKKPPFFGSFLPNKILDYFLICIFIYMYGLLYQLSNPYIADNFLLQIEFIKKNNNDNISALILNIIYCIYYLINPITIIYIFLFNCDSTNKLLPEKEHSFYYYNFNPVLLVHFFIFMIFFINPVSLIKNSISPQKKILSFLNTSPIELGILYTFDELKKYYEIKKLQLFNLIIDSNTNDKNINDFSPLINNYMLTMKYIKQFMDKKMTNQDNKNDLNLEKKEEDSPLIDEVLIRNNELLLTGDISYNQNFISNYEVYSNYSLMKNL